MVEFSNLYLYIIFIILLSDILLILYLYDTEKIKCRRLRFNADFVKTMIIIIYTAYILYMRFIQ